MKRRTPAFEHVVYLYRTWATSHGGVWNKKDAWQDLRGDVIAHLRSTLAIDDWDQLAEMLFNLADDGIVHAGEKEVRDGDRSEPLPLFLPYSLDAILALGDGDRCAFGDMRMSEWVRHDAKKYSNMRAVQDAYDEWRQKSNHLLPGFARGLSVREICDEYGTGSTQLRIAS